MVFVMPKSWLADLRSLLGSTGLDPIGPSDALGVLGFEAAATMSRLLSIYRSLADTEIVRLRSHTMRAEGVGYLVSTDQSFLLRLACGELLADLDRAADAAARLGSRCSTAALLSHFERVYADAKAGGLAHIDATVGFTKGAAKRLKKMERHVAVTARLYTEMDVLNELEASERRMHQWMRHSGPIPAVQKPDQAEPLRRELKSQRQRVRRLMEESLWRVTPDKAAKLMAKSVLAVLARLSMVFGPFVPGLPPMSDRTRVHSPRFRHSSGPLERPIMTGMAIRHSAPLFRSKDASSTDLIKPSPNTIAGSGMALRYANVILEAERLLAARSSEEDQSVEPVRREELYEMLPVAIRAAVKAKLRECWRSQAAADVDAELAKGWEEAVGRILRWLGPMARDTARWHDERNMDRQQRFSTQPRALMLHTLHFADREKAEAAIVEVLVGLSCMCWYDERHRQPAMEEF